MDINRIASEDQPRPWRAKPEFDPDHTAPRIRAYAASIKPLTGIVFRDDVQEQMDRARVLLERLAQSARGADTPTLKLTPAQCADLLTLMSCSDPVDMAAWWLDRNDVSHVCGFTLVLDAMAASLRSSRGQAGTAQRV